MNRFVFCALVLGTLCPAPARAQSDLLPESPFRRESLGDIQIELQLRFGVDPVRFVDELPMGMTPLRSPDRNRLLSTFGIVVAGEMTLNGVRYGGDGATTGAAYWWIEMEDEIPVRSSDLRPGRHAVELGYWLADDSAVARSDGARSTRGAAIAASPSGRDWVFTFSAPDVEVKGRCRLSDDGMRPETPRQRVRTVWRAGEHAAVFHVIAYQGGESGPCDLRELTVTGESEFARALRAAFVRDDVRVRATTGGRVDGGSSYGYRPIGCPERTGAGSVTGRIRFDGVPDAGVRVWLDGPVHCYTESDSTGAFAFRHVPPGRYEVTTGASFRTRHVDPVVVRVAENATVSVNFSLEPADIEADCRDLRYCRPFLNPVPSNSLSPDVDPLEATGFLTGIAITLATRYGHDGWAVCVDDVSDVLLAELRRLAPLAVPGEECGMLGDGLHAPYRHLPTGRHAFWVGFKVVARHPVWAVASVATGHGRLAAIGRECIYVRTPSGWRLGSCRRTWIS